MISSSFKLIDILIENADRKVTRLQAEIQQLEGEIAALNLPEATTKNYDIVKTVLSNHQNDIKQRKACKLKRDELDYNSGRVFTFSKKYDYLLQSDKNKQTSEPISTSSSNTSLSTIPTSESENEGELGTSVRQLHPLGNSSFLPRSKSNQEGKQSTQGE